ncbi:ATP-dependent protease La (LON) domain protein [Zea mays]|uniref:ATP-dependent protease La (LON) domain protein n=1 Tax=Zea mays TaxID=4577 RepID=A0A1D6NCV1_MAIZE|nr:ATP-dependent protease La (LON) domain protein [Zea mays]
MAERDRVLERERRQMEQILELDMEELQVEEVDDDGSSSSSDVDTFLRSDRAHCPFFLTRVFFNDRNTHGDGGINTYEELSIDTSTVSLQDHTYLGAKVDGARGKFAFLHGDRVLNLPMFYLQGVVLFPEASLHLRVFQPRLVEAIDKAINHVDAPCMIGVVYVYRHTNDGHYTIASVGTMAEVWFLSYLITSYVMCTFGLPPC